MSVDLAVELAREAVWLTLLVGAPVMLAAIGVGLVISILQAVTQVQDQTLSFAPKIVAMFLVLLYTLPWALNRMVEYSTELFRSVAGNL
ncbi:MAG TPA: flagellar biosynthesis protein FliQ [Planctomycetaceae bacterium]|nr:flagellar biosynthesis protein FliQ [Planctomycetaceae bacterium]